MNVLIVDDDFEFAKYFEKLFYDFFSKKFKNISIEIITNDFSSFMHLDIDICFIDIDLKSNSGINIASYIKKISEKTIIIFVSSKEELVFKALSVGLFHFIRKSHIDEDSIVVFNDLSNYLERNNKKLLLNVNGRKTLVQLLEIEYILSIGKDLVIVGNNFEFSIKSSIKAFLKEVDQVEYKDLIQINRNIVINMCYIENIEKTKLTLKNGIEHNIGKIYCKNVIEKYEEFLLR